MKITVHSEEQIKQEASRFTPWPRGEYDFEIAEASDEVSKAGNDMIKLKVTIYNGDGNKRFIFDYLMDKIPVKLRHAAEAVGAEDQYESGELSALDFEGKTGRCVVYIKKEAGREDQNAIADYVKPRETVRRPATPAARAPMPSTRKAPARDIDDEIPF